MAETRIFQMEIEIYGKTGNWWHNIYNFKFKGTQEVNGKVYNLYNCTKCDNTVAVLSDNLVVHKSLCRSDNAWCKAKIGLVSPLWKGVTCQHCLKLKGKHKEMKKLIRVLRREDKQESIPVKIEDVEIARLKKYFGR